MANKSLAILLAAVCLMAVAQSACIDQASTVLSSCSSYITLVQNNKSLSGASDATLKSAIDSLGEKPSTECCNAAASIATISPPCACDADVISSATSFGATGNDLLTLQRAASIACAELSPAITVAAPSQSSC